MFAIITMYKGKKMYVSGDRLSECFADKYKHAKDAYYMASHLNDINSDLRFEVEELPVQSNVAAEPAVKYINVK